jgi:OOP family OmpA-OmpF porin
MPTADVPRAGQVTLGFYGWKDQRIAGNLAFSDSEIRSRLYAHWAGEVSVGLGLTENWEAWISGGAERFESRGGWAGGSLNSIQLFGPFRANEPRKIEIGTKYRFFSEADNDFRLGIWGAARIPMGQGNVHVDQSVNQTDVDSINTRRTDWQWGVVGTKGWVSAGVSYLLSSEHDNDIRVSNQLRAAIGVDWPLLPILHIITEVDRTIYDGGDLPEENYSLLTTGARFWIGHTGWSVSGALNANLDLLFRHGFSPSPLGGMIGVGYAAWPPPPPPPVVVPAPAPAAPIQTEEKTETVTTQPPPPAPVPPAPRTTRDEIQFTAGSARLTNIAKAILDGIALRMKNDLNATAVVTGYSDNSGAEPANVAISGKRADAAKEYLVTRHGIDPNRITTAAKGSSDAAYDNATAEGKAKNRRAVIVVTLVSGS